MVDTILAGPDGQPAIDQATGQPLTMEVLMRRRGIIPVGNGMNSASASAVPVSTDAASASAPSGLAGALAARASGMQQPAMPVPPVDPNAMTAPSPVAAVDPNVAATGDSFDPTALLQAAGVGAATGLGYALAKRKKTQPGITAKKFGAGDLVAAPKPGMPANEGTQLQGTRINPNAKRLPNAPIEGEYTVVEALGNRARQALTGPAGKALTRAIR